MKDIRTFHLNWIRLYIRFLTSKNRSFDKFLTNKGLECVGNNQLWMVPVWHSKEVMLIRVTHLFYNIIFSSGKWSAASAAVFNSLLRTLQFFCCSNKYSKRLCIFGGFFQVTFFLQVLSWKVAPNQWEEVWRRRCALHIKEEWVHHEGNESLDNSQENVFFKDGFFDVVKHTKNANDDDDDE